MDRRKFIINSVATATGLAFVPKSANAWSNKSVSNTNGDVLVDGNKFTLNPADNGSALVNPDMGWTMHFYSNVITNYGSKLEPSDTLDDFPGISTVYLRVPWSFIEIEEGKFNWELLDTPAQRWIEKGKKVALRITAEESWMKYATPEWVKDAGAEGYEKKIGGVNIWEPKFDDVVFLKKVDNFLSEMASRYDSNPNVAFIDVGHYGLWGEGHTHLTGQFYPLEVQKKHIDIYLKHFKNTLLCISDDFAGSTKPGKNFPITDYAFSKGVTIRDDSILVSKAPRQWYHAEMAQQFWPTLPVILEHQHYGASLKSGAWDKDLFLQSVEDYHASYMSIHWWPRILLEENREVIDKINLRMGYRIQLNEVSWPTKVKAGESFAINSEWSNAGVAPCYRGGFPCFTIKDKKGGIVTVLVDEQFDIRKLQTAEIGKSPSKKLSAEFTIGSQFKDTVKTFARNVQTGIFELYVSVGNADGTPVYELPYSGNDGFNRYKMGQIEVTERN